jgi:WD40 repeat protein
MRGDRGAVSGYDAFMSYSHAHDGRLAPLFQREVERFAKRWNQSRALRVFRDDANLVASAALWPSIVAAMSSSRWFVLMASPDAARSPWVDAEVAWWLENRSIDTLLIVVTAGDVVWGPGGVDRTASTALPPSLVAALRVEPRWVDLRALVTAEEIDWADPRLRDRVADVAGAIHGVSKDAVVGEHVRQHRRTMRLARGGATALAVLLVAALVAAVVAVWQGTEATQQARIATARQLAATALSEVDNQLDLAQLLAVEAHRMNPDDPQTRAALFQTFAASPYLKRHQQLGRPVSAVGSGQSVAVAGTADGHLVRWDVRDDGTTSAQVGERAVTAVAASDDGRVIAAADGTAVVLWRGDDVKPEQVFEGPASRVAVSPSGKTVAVAGGSAPFDDGPLPLVVIDGTTGAELRRTTVPFAPGHLALPDDKTLMMNTGADSWRRLAVADFRQTDESENDIRTPAAFFCCGYSRNGAYFAWAKYADFRVQPQSNTPAHGVIAGSSIPIEQPEEFAVSDDGTMLAAAGGEVLYVQGDFRRQIPQRLPGAGRVTGLAFLDPDRLVSGSGSALILWDLTQVSRAPAGPPSDAPDSSNAGPPPRVAVSPDGRWVASAGEGEDVLVRDVAEQRDLPVQHAVPNALPVWSADSGTLMLLGDDGGHDATLWSEGGAYRGWKREAGGRVFAAAASPDGKSLVLVGEAGVVERDPDDGRVRLHVPVEGLPEDSGSDRQWTAAVRPDARFAAVIDGNGSVRVIDVEAEESRALPRAGAVSVAYGPDHLVVRHEDSGIEVWNGDATELLRVEAADASYQRAMAVVGDHGLLARITAQGTVVLSDVATGEPLGTVALPMPERSTGAPPWGSTTVVASGRGLATATSSGAVVRWELDPARWRDSACATAGRDLTADEWRGYVDLDPPENLDCSR